MPKAHIKYRLLAFTLLITIILPLFMEKVMYNRIIYSNFALEKMPVHLENSIKTGNKIA